MGISVTDNALHIIGGAALAAPLVVWPSPVTTFIVFSFWGLLREQAQKHVRGMNFEQNWIDIWNKNKLIEGLSWGFGAAAFHTATRIIG